MPEFPKIHTLSPRWSIRFMSIWVSQYLLLHYHSGLVYKNCWQLGKLHSNLSRSTCKLLPSFHWIASLLFGLSCLLVVWGEGGRCLAVAWTNMWENDGREIYPIHRLDPLYTLTLMQMLWKLCMSVRPSAETQSETWLRCVYCPPPPHTHTQKNETSWEEADGARCCLPHALSVFLIILGNIDTANIS
jgi:hypothetical protein